MINSNLSSNKIVVPKIIWKIIRIKIWIIKKREKQELAKSCCYSLASNLLFSDPTLFDINDLLQSNQLLFRAIIAALIFLNVVSLTIFIIDFIPLNNQGLTNLIQIKNYYWNVLLKSRSPKRPTGCSLIHCPDVHLLLPFPLVN